MNKKVHCKEEFPPGVKEAYAQEYMSEEELGSAWSEPHRVNTFDGSCRVTQEAVSPPAVRESSAVLRTH